MRLKRIAMAGGACLMLASAHAATIFVSNNGDSGVGSLREALANANRGDTIRFNSNVTGTITLTSGELVVARSVVILGPGASGRAVSGNHSSRVFHIIPGIEATIVGLTITGGVVADDFPGGGIYNDRSTLIVNGCSLGGNLAGYGGGIFNGGSRGIAKLSIINSILSGDLAVRSGGGIYNEGAGGGLNGNAALSVANSTFSSNVGGDILNAGGLGGNAILTAVNSTFGGGSTNHGGIYNILEGFGGGSGGSAIVALGSTILNASSLGNMGGVVTSLGCNLSSDDGGGFLNQPTDLTSTNPMLGPLQLNGGQTPTHALLCGSPAIDAGTNFTGSATDQRGDGFPRMLGWATDIGAFEADMPCNQPPVALCHSVIVSARSGCQANASIDAGSYDPDAGDTIALIQDPPGPYGLGTNAVTLTVTDSYDASDSCSALVIVLDTDPPRVACRAAPNPSGRIPGPGRNDDAGVNPSGHYQVLANDSCDPEPRIYIKDTDSRFVAGPFKDGDIVRLKHTGGAPMQEAGRSPTVAVISLNGNGVAVAADAAGNTTREGDGCVMEVR